MQDQKTAKSKETSKQLELQNTLHPKQNKEGSSDRLPAHDKKQNIKLRNFYLICILICMIFFLLNLGYDKRNIIGVDIWFGHLVALCFASFAILGFILIARELSSDGRLNQVLHKEFSLLHCMFYGLALIPCLIAISGFLKPSPGTVALFLMYFLYAPFISSFVWMIVLSQKKSVQYSLALFVIVYELTFLVRLLG